MDLIEWNAAAEAALKPALKAALPAIRQQVLAGEAGLHIIGQCWVVLRVEHGLMRELVVVGVAGRNLRPVTTAIIKLGKRIKADSIRWHCERPALSRLVDSSKWYVAERRASETVFRLEL